MSMDVWRLKSPRYDTCETIADVSTFVQSVLGLHHFDCIWASGS
jgi:hypothetical protein